MRSVPPGFTLIELLVVIAIIAIIAALLLPSLTKAKEKGLSIACQNKLRQLQICWHSYVMDNRDTVPPNQSVYDVNTGAPIPGADLSLTWCPGNTRVDTNTANIQSGYLYVYNHNATIYHCPADRSTVVLPDGTQTGLLRTRSYNMSESFNGIPFSISSGLSDMPCFAKLTQVIQPSTSDAFVFIDVHEDGILDSLFGIPWPGSFYPDMWWDLPANRHSQGCNFSLPMDTLNTGNGEFPRCSIALVSLLRILLSCRISEKFRPMSNPQIRIRVPEL